MFISSPQIVDKGADTELMHDLFLPHSIFLILRWEKNLPSDGSKPSMVETGRRSKSFALEPGFFTAEDTAY